VFGINGCEHSPDHIVSIRRAFNGKLIPGRSQPEQLSHGVGFQVLKQRGHQRSLRAFDLAEKRLEVKIGIVHKFLHVKVEKVVIVIGYTPLPYFARPKKLDALSGSAQGVF
jgi:hypothetical protein